MQRMLTHPPSLSLSMKIKLKLSVRISTSGGTSGGRLSSTSSTPAPPLYKSDGAPVNTGGDPSTLSDPNGGAAPPNAGANTTAAPSTAVRVDSKKTDSVGFIKGFSEELGKLVAKDGWEKVVKELKKKNLVEWIKTLMALGMIIKHMISGKLPPSLPPP